MFLTPALALAQVHVSTEAELRAAITTATAGSIIVLDANVTLTADLPSIETDLTFDGSGHTLSGNDQFRGLVVADFDDSSFSVPDPVSVTIQNLTIANTVATGGDGGDGSAGGGGGAGFGGALLVADGATVTLSNVNLVSSQAVGGSGGTAVPATFGGGGGGLGGDGGTGILAGGGGGGVGSTAVGGSDTAGAPGILTGAGPGGSSGTPGGDNGGGGGSSTVGGGGGGGSGESAFNGPGSGGFGGGGGGGLTSIGGFGGFGGGGGGGAFGGSGGYGGGAGGSTVGSLSFGGFFGGDGGATTGSGGGGAGLGGAIFVQSGGTLNIAGSFTINGSTVSGGAGGAGAEGGEAHSAGMFLQGFGTIMFTQAAGETAVVNDAIDDERTYIPSDPDYISGIWSLHKDGAGTLVLGGINGYTGGTVVNDGTLRITDDRNLGSGGLSLFDTSTLDIAAGGLYTHNIFAEGTPTIKVAAGQSVTWSGQIVDDASARFTVTGGGTLTLGNTANFYSGGTVVTGGSTVAVAADGALGSASGDVTLGDGSSGGTLAATAGFSSARSFVLGAGGGTIAVQGASSLLLSGPVSGNGALTKTGTGTLTLSGNNTYTGPTTAAAGVLQAGDTDVFAVNGAMTVLGGATLDLNSFGQTVGSLSGAGNVTLGSATLTTGGDGTSTAYSGVIGGTGALVKTGGGALVLSGANNYTGGTTVLGGSLIGTSTSLQGGILNNALVVFDQPGSGTYAGVMTGTGELQKSGVGALTLTGANTYSGGTTVLAGALVGTSVSLQGPIFNNALVVFDQAATGTYAGVMSGTGVLAKTAAGTLTLTGANTYSGGTTVSGGALVGTTTSLQGNFVNNALVVFDQAATGTYAGVMSGTGVFAKSSGGTLTLTGANSYSGGTIVSAGALVGTSTSLQGNFLNNALVVFDQSISGSYSGLMTGIGALTKSGSGSLVLSGANTYSGGTTVSGGALIGTSTSLQGAILNNALVVFDQNTNGSYAGVMSGTGSLAKRGTGTLALAGTNSYGGGTVITGNGAVSITSDAALGAAGAGVVLGDAASGGGVAFGAGSVFASVRPFALGTGGGTFDTADASAISLEGAITGSGGLTKSGPGRLTLAGANTYSGSTTVAGGVLEAGAGNVFGANGAMAVAAGATLDLHGFSQTVGALSGGGNVTLGNATLTTGGSASSLFSGAISGGGSLVKTGGGTLALTGTNTYTGGTTVAGGALVGTTASLQGNFVNNALVVFDQSGSGAYAGSMSGSGGLLKTGSGSVSLTGSNTYTGGTVINGGSLIGTTASLQGTIQNNATLTLFAIGDNVFNGILTGTGSLNKTGSGAITLLGTHPMTGLTTVVEGTLVLNGLLGGGVTINAGAILRATGVIAGSVNVAGSLYAVPPSGGATALLGVASEPSTGAASTGDALITPPILTIGGDLNAIRGSVLGFPIGAGPNPTILVGGQAAIDGSHLDLSVASPVTQRATSFIALTALRGLSFTNTDAATDNPLLVPFLTTDANSLFVTLLNLGIPLSGVVTNPNAVSVGTAIDRFKLEATGDRALVIRELTALDDSGLNDALENLAGEIHASSLQLAVLDSEAFTDTVRRQIAARDREADAAGETGWGGDKIRWWSQIGGEHATFDGRGGARGATANMGAGAGGFDWRLSDRWMFGAGGGFGAGRMGLSVLDASTDFNAPRGFGYLGYKAPGFGLRAGGSTARTKYKTKRRMAFAAALPLELGAALLTGGIDREAETEQEGLVSDTWSEYDDNLDVKSYTVDWTVGMRHARFNRNGFAESGASSLSLSGEDQTLKLTQTDVKVHIWRRKGNIRPYLETTFRRELTDGKTTTELQFVNVPDSEFSVDGIPIPGNTFVGRGGVTIRTWLGFWTFEYEIRKAPGQSRQAADVRVRFK